MTEDYTSPPSGPVPPSPGSSSPSSPASSPSLEFIAPSSRAFDRMKRVLFQPFDISKWFVLGFTAWLATLLDGGGSGSGGSYETTESENGDVGVFFREIGQWLGDHLFLAITLGSVLLLVIVAVLAALLWVSSRGKFMFLDNLAHNRALVKAPWAEFRDQGDSLFWWNVGFTLIVLTVLGFIGGAFALGIFALGDAAWMLIFPGIIVFLPLILLLIYITTMLEDFVVPLMYQRSLTTTEAWKHFLQVHRGAAGSFVLFTLWKILLLLAVFVGVVALGLGTCCIGFLFLAIPYIGSVLLLPVTTFFRFLGPAFLRQFGEDYDMLPTMADDFEFTAPATPTGPANPGSGPAPPPQAG